MIIAKRNPLMQRHLQREPEVVGRYTGLIAAALVALGAAAFAASTVGAQHPAVAASTFAAEAGEGGAGSRGQGGSTGGSTDSNADSNGARPAGRATDDAPTPDVVVDDANARVIATLR